MASIFVPLPKDSDSFSCEFIVGWDAMQQTDTCDAAATIELDLDW